MKTLTRTAILSMTLLGMFAFSVNTSADSATSAKVAPKKLSVPTLKPVCPWNDPNGCGILD